MYCFDDYVKRLRIIVCDCGSELSLTDNDLCAIMDKEIKDIRCQKCGNVYLENYKECYKKGPKLIR